MPNTSNEPSLVKVLVDPAKFYPERFETPKRAQAFLHGLCAEAAIELEARQSTIADLLHAMQSLMVCVSMAGWDDDFAMCEAKRVYKIVSGKDYGVFDDN